jgi:hypothetical protein
MKYTNSKYTFILFALLFFFACSEKEPIKGLSNKISISTTSVSSITSDSALSGGTISDDGGDVISDRGLCWSTNQVPTVNDSKVSSGNGKGSFSTRIRGLMPNTTYYVRAYSVSNQGEVYGNEISFKTLIRIPTTNTTNVTNITGSTATTGGQVVSDGGGAITDRGVCWSPSNLQPTINDNRISIGSGSTIFPINLTNLLANTTYWVRSYAVNTAGIGYGNVVAFRTSPPTIPELSVASIINIGRNTATASATVSSNGGALLNNYGVCVSTSSSMNPRVCFWINGNNLGSFTVSMNNLLPGTTYYGRAYANNIAGEGASTATTSFTTLAPLPPTVSTSGSSNVLFSSASMTGNVTDDGGLPVLERGFFISMSTPTLSSTKVVASSTGTGSYSANASGLSPGTTYYYRAYAINAVNTSLSSTILSFTTSQPTAPTVTAISASSILFSSASMAGNVTNDGGLPVLERGFFIGMSTPTLSSTKVVASSTGIGSYSASASGLTHGTTYYFRAYARNAVNTSLSPNTVSFTTQQATTPVVITTQESNVLANTINTGGNVMSDGGVPIISRGVIWSRTPGVNISNSTIVSSGSGSGSFSTTLSGLPANTIIYFRAFAQNASGLVGYGSERSVTTPMLAPLLSSPLNNANLSCCYWNFNWQAVSGATSYQIQISGNSGFSSATTTISQCGSGFRPSISSVNVYTTNTTSACLNAALSSGNGIWYWRVRAISGGNFSDWSVVRIFNYRY